MPKNEDVKTCWEYWNCKPQVRAKCPAFKSEEPCWRVAADYCGRVPNKRGMMKCFTCAWYSLKHRLKR